MNVYYNPPKFAKITPKNHYSINSGLCNVGYIQCHNSQYYGYELFASSGVGEHAYNILPSHIEISSHLKWKNQVRKGPLFLLRFKIKTS